MALPDGRALRTVRGGAGRPVVVFEAGMSACASEWVAVQRQVSAVTRTLSYDRAGLGGSDEDAHDRTVSRIVDDLAALLDAAGEPGPYVLVGHSWGGPILRALVALHPRMCAAMVLVDDTTSEVMTARQAAVSARLMRATAALSRLHLAGPLLRSLTPAPSGLDDDDKAIVNRDYGTAAALHTGRREAQHIASHVGELARMQQEGTPSDAAFVKIIGGKADRGGKKLRETHLRESEAEANRHPHGRFVRAEHSSHFVPQQEPALVAEEIVRAVRAVQAAERT